jgi:hypothetical protein
MPFAKNLKELKKYFPFLTPAGAGIAIICFFLPWVKVSCGTITVEASGARIGGIFWLVFAAAILILISFFYFRKRKDRAIGKMIALYGSALSMLVILYKFISTFSGGSADINFSDFGSVIRPGAFGEFLGFIMALVGSIYMIDDTNQNHNHRPHRHFPYLKKKKDAPPGTEIPDKE